MFSRGKGTACLQGHVPAIPMLQVMTEFTPTSPLEAKFLVRKVNEAGVDAPPSGSSAEHSFLQQLLVPGLAGFPSPLLPVSGHTEPRRAAQGWQKCPIFTEGSLTLSSDCPQAVWDAAEGGGTQPCAGMWLIPGTR